MRGEHEKKSSDGLTQTKPNTIKINIVCKYFKEMEKYNTIQLTQKQIRLE